MSAVKTGGPLEWHNAGPLTTTWTAPAACATSGSPIRSGAAEPGFIYAAEYYVDGCDGYKILEECRPNGDKVEEIYGGQDIDVQPTLTHYYSPANQCPQDWATVGIAAMNNGSVSATGLFSPTVFPNGSPTETTEFPYANWIANIFTTILEPTETAIACCPSGYTAELYAGCYSHFPLTELASRTACRFQYIGGGGEDIENLITETFEWNGVTTTVSYRRAPFTSGWRDSEDAVTETVPFDSAGRPSPTGTRGGYGNSSVWESGIALVQPMFLVDVGDAEEPASNGTDENAARTLTPNGWGAIGAIMAAWGISIVAGVGLLAAW